MSMADVPPADCIPVRVKFADRDPTVSWCFDDGLAFDDPFFDESVHRCMRRPFNRAFMPQTPISALAEFADTHAGRPPDAFIFHMSRCGSTLLAQMFTQLPDTRVISEASPIDRILAAGTEIPGLTVQTQVQWLRALMRCYGVRRHVPFARHVIKLDAWHIDQLGLIEQAFPDVPWVFLYRHPLEVLVSNLALRAAKTLPGLSNNQLPGVDMIAALQMPPEQYLALILRQHMQAALMQRSNPRAMYVNYTDLPAAALPSILEHFRMALDPSQIGRMLAKAMRDAKHPDAAFVPDAVRKQQQAGALAREICDSLLMPVFEQLQAIRWRPA